MALKPFNKNWDRTKIPQFSVYDIETTTDLKNVYLVEWYDGTDSRTFESQPLPPEHRDSAISQFLRWWLSRARRYPLYAHNGGNFDTVFALKSLIMNNPECRIEIIPSQSSILLMKVVEGKHKWEFRDSARTLPDSLDNLAQCFLGERKMIIDDYATLHLNPLRYEYIKRDCKLLFDVLTKYFELLYNRLGGQAGISAASTSLKTFRSSYQSRELPAISDHAARLARAGYYGGRCEPFRREFVPRGTGAEEIRANAGHPGDILKCYDVNSMYPWAMKERQPVRELWFTDKLCLELSGFIDCEIEVQDCHMPVLPCRQSGKLLFPTGRWRGTFSTVELRFAIECGQARILKFYDAAYFDTADIFTEYVDTLYKFRDKTSPDWQLPLDRMAKIGLNSLYGKFGSQESRETIHVRPTFGAVVEKQMQQMASPLSVDCWIEQTITKADYMLPQISAWITALGRIKLATELLNQETDAYYCDTDSIYTPRTIPSGSGLGQWKDEYSSDPIVYAYFLSPKVYVLKHASGKVTNKAKGFSKFAEKLPDNAVALLSAGTGLEVSRFAKARSVIRGDFGLMLATKRCRMNYEKRIFAKDGTSRPRRVGIDE